MVRFLTFSRPKGRLQQGRTNRLRTRPYEKRMVPWRSDDWDGVPEVRAGAVPGLKPEAALEMLEAVGLHRLPLEPTQSLLTLYSRLRAMAGV